MSSTTSATTTSLTMDKPIKDSILDHTVQEVLGKPLDRIDGPVKVSGAATYAAEFAFDDLTYGYLVRADYGAGTIEAIDATEALAMSGVIDVVHDFEGFIRNAAQGGETEGPTQGVQEVAYFGQPIAIVVAESYEIARDAALRVRVQVKPKLGDFSVEGRQGEAFKPADASAPAHAATGDLEQAMLDADVTLDQTYTTPSQNSAAMEPHASTAQWDGGKLTIHGSYQMLASDRLQLADTLGMDPENVRIVALYVGGGFGSKLGIAPEVVAAALAAKKIGRPVKTVMTRPQVFEATVRRSDTSQRIRLAAGADGRLTGIGHETLCSNLDGEEYFEPAGIATHFLYPGDHRLVTHDIIPVNRTLSGSMRAPGEAVGMLALENAMDELAEKLGIDPVELRRRNEPAQDPSKAIPYSSRKLQDCLDAGAKSFGWDQRNATPGAMRDGEWLIGHGMAASTRSNILKPSRARVSLTPEGRAIVETDQTDIGTGSYTILGQIAAEMLGLPLDQVDVKLGDTDFPPAAGSGGSWGAGSSGSSVYLACEGLRAKLARAMDTHEGSLTLKDGRAIAGNRAVPLADLVGEGLTQEGSIEPGETSEAVSQASYGAHFCEVRVNAVTGEVRVARWVSAFAAGRILNEKTARSQCIGGIVFGIGAALTEELIHDDRTGKCVNRDLGEYHVPVHADVPPIEVIFVEERDVSANPLQAKGIGELGISGAGAAVTNAIYNATGVRVRSYPMTCDKLLAGLPD
ncbi:xanthine dehydrogenase family protein molybdopterin-binding subunit [Sphingomonas sp. S1-29]|uniref:xanthine dehydrogenase family protein molybdopterin-binding subunit n=1 Tax=Sphingomonas sp. S1-29 TaxID=2991074 RepID=UPI00224054D1|nr:xanthine dehydrogenase family protein molybdopterin-binding subunit [Sphingomonas sp. S1-29]UZK69141.1 xanthine dehydrogenase family protein molybdopterin-binding subunit [Sphingomonas sp. S1-29]